MAKFTPEEKDELTKAFAKLGIQPNLDDPDSFKSWMENYGHDDQSKGAVSQVLYSPKISVFSGEAKDANFDLWLYEVKCLMQESSYSTDTIKQAVRKSLRGEPAKIAMRLGPTGSLTELLAKLKGIYGTVDLGETVLGQFCSACQKPGEDVASWSCRIEDMSEKVKDSGKVSQTALPELLRSRFWSGMRQPLKNVSGHLYKTITDFDTLRVEMRRIENEFHLKEGKPKGKEQCHSAVTSVEVEGESKSEMSQLKNMVYRLTSKVDKLQETQDQRQNQVKQHINVTEGTGSQPGKADCSSRSDDRQTGTQSNEERSFTYRQTGQRRGRGRGRPRERPLDFPYEEYSPVGYGQYETPRRSFVQRSNQRYRYEYTEDGQPICARCRQIGHIQLGCRVILDHMNQQLNEDKPALRTERQVQGQ